MIESDLISLIDLKDSILTIDTYSNPYLIRFFRFFYLIKQYKQKRYIVELLFKICYYTQILFICLINVSDNLKKNDVLIKIILTLKNILYVGDVVDNKTKFIIATSLGYFICFFMIFLIIYIVVMEKKSHSYPLKLFNYIYIFFENYLFGFLIVLFLMSTKCENKNFVIFKDECQKSTKHNTIMAISLFCLGFIIIYSILISIYYNEIGGIQHVHLYKRINNHYEIYLNLFSIIIYFAGYYIEFHSYKNREILNIFIRGLIFFISCILIIYMRKKVYFYEKRLNFLYFTGWSYICWFSLSLLLQEFFNLKQSLFFVIIGWFLIFLLNYYIINLHGEEILTETNIFEAKSAKEIELFISNFFNIMNDISHHSQLLLSGLINTIVEIFETNPEILEKYEKFISNKILIEKFGGKGNITFDTYSIVYVIYEYLLEKSKLKVDALFLMSYFCINKLHNYSLAISICTKNKVIGYLNHYNKFCLMEDIKQCLTKSFNSELKSNDSIRHIDIGSVILYTKLIDILKIKIYDATSNQVDYLDILRNSTTSLKASRHFLDFGNHVLILKKEIIKTWENIVNLNPFSDEIRKDYMLYLRNIIQDYELANKEDLKYNAIKINKFSEKNDTYHSLFNKDITVTILIDGNSSQGKIIYTSLNFLTLYNFTPKDLFNYTINDLIPKCIESYHKALIINALKYSNLRYIFKKEKDILMKGKGNSLYNVKAFFKTIPNLSCGLIYIGMLAKIQDKQFLVLLDQNFKIDSMTNPSNNGNFGNNIYSMNFPFGLNGNLHGYHIGIIIPEILKLIKFKELQFTIDKTDIDFKGKLYSISNDLVKYETVIEELMEKIKINGNLEIFPNNHNSSKNLTSISKSKFFTDKYSQTNLREYNELLNDLDEKFPIYHQVFYRITKHSFLNDKHIYYRVYIVNDIIESNEFNKKKKNSSKKMKESTQIVTENILLPNTIIEPGKEIRLKPSETKDEIKSNQNKDNKEEKNNNNINTLQIASNKDINNEYELLNELKRRIFNNDIPSYIIYMWCFSFIFSILTMILIIYNNNLMYSKFQYIQIYLDQNYFFNHTKIAMSSLYYATVNLKMLKYKIMGKDGCINGIHCVDHYQFILERGLRDVKKYTDRTIKYDNDYQVILQKIKSFEFYTNNLTNKTDFYLNIPDLLYFILSNGIEIEKNAIEYINETNDDSLTDTYIENILNHAVIYLYSNEANGLNEYEKRINANTSKFKSNKIYLILNIILFVIVFLLLLGITIKFYNIEVKLLYRMIKFNSPKFDIYFKYLEELKKKLRRDNGEEEEKNESDNGNESKGNDDEKSKSDKGKKKKDKKQIKTSQKKKLAKVTKLQQQKSIKFKIMRRYFFLYNFFFSIKICGICVIIMIYYPIIFLLYNIRRERFFKYDDFMSSCEGIFVDAYEAFGTLKNQTIFFANYIIERNKKINELNNNISIVEFKGINYTKDNITELKKKKFIFEIPEESERTVTKFGNLITEFTANTDITKNSTETVLVKLYNGNACEVLFHLYEIDEEKYEACLNFWSSIVTQGIEQCLTQLEVEMTNIISLFIEINNSNEIFNNLQILEHSFTECEEFITNYLFYAYKETIIIFIALEMVRSGIIYSGFDIMKTVFIFVCIILFFILSTFIYFENKDFGDFLKFVEIFPIIYLIEDENFYKDIINVKKELYG